jgi:hypothetical protein
MTKRILFGALLVTAAGLLWQFIGPAPESAKAASAGDVPFKGKVIAVYTNTPVQAQAMLDNVRVRQLAGKQFLVGKHIDAGFRPSDNGRTMWVAVDSITQIVEYEDAQDVKKAIEDQRKARPDLPVPVPAQPPRPAQPR